MKRFRFIIICIALVLLCAGCSAYSYDEEYQKNSEEREAREKASINDYFDAFETVDIYGNDFDSSFFTEHELTLVNVWTTWCPPCKEEIPELQKVEEKYADQGFAVLGVLYDGVKVKTAEAQPDKIAAGVKLMENSGASYTVIIPEESLLRGVLSAITAFPTSFFVDGEGNIIETAVYYYKDEIVLVDNPYIIGANDMNGWSHAVEYVLSGALDE